MKRIIPKNTRVSTEFFKDVSLTDICVGLFGILVVSLLWLSNIPGRFGMSIALGLVFLALLLRVDDEPNYMLLFRINQHFACIRKYRNPSLPKPALMRDDSEEYALALAENAASDEAEREPDIEQRLAQLQPEERDEAIINYLFDPESPDLRTEEETPSVRSALRQNVRRQLAESRVNRSRKRQLSRIRKDEDWLLKSKEVPEGEKAFIRARQKRRAEVNYYNEQVQKQYRQRKDIHKIIGVTDIAEGFIWYKSGYYGAAIEIPAVEFRFFSDYRRTNSINRALGGVIRMATATYSTNLVKVEQPMVLDNHIENEIEKIEQLRQGYQAGIITEAEMKARVELIYSRMEQLDTLNEDNKILIPHYYMVFFGSDKWQLNATTANAIRMLEAGEMHPKRLNDKELAVFLRYTNGVDFDQREIEDLAPEEYADFILPDSLELRPRSARVNNIITHNFRVTRYPLIVEDAWAAPLMDIPGTKVVVKFSQMDQEKSIRAIDRSISELRSRLNRTDVSSRVLELETHIETLQELLTMLNNANESLIAANMYVTAYDLNATRANKLLVPQPPVSSLPNMSNMKKEVRRQFTERGFRVSDLLFQQVNGFIATQVSGYDPMFKSARGMPATTLAAMFPWVYANLQDPKGVTLGSSDGVPTFIDFFRRDQERVNSNIVVVGKSGGGKSYAVKSMLANLAADDSKIFVLDPENEYTELAHNLNGKFINVANSSQGRINPFHILTTLEDDEQEEGQETSSFAAHLQFLEEFFRQILPEVSSDAMEYLNNLVNRVYAQKGIDQYTNLSQLRPTDYPTFDDLYDCVLEEFTHADSNYIRSNLRVLVNYIAKFSTGGRNSSIWNGPSTLDTLENFIVFNFQTLLSNRNNTIANAQMLLVLKYLDNEIIKNRDYNLKNRANRRVIVVIDEAHVFIDSKYPLALDFMYQLAKRIRKYNGMQIVITQNIKDFVGSEELARKSTAIINACQYSFIFSLAPNDMTDLCALYEKAGGINEQEQEQIVNAARGQAFVVTGPSNRSTMYIETPKGIEAMFTQMDYMEERFRDPAVQESWEQLMEDSGSPALPAEAPQPPIWEEAVPARREEVSIVFEEQEPSAADLRLEQRPEDDDNELLRVPEASLTVSEREEKAQRQSAAERSIHALHGEETAAPEQISPTHLEAIKAQLKAELMNELGVSAAALAAAQAALQAVNANAAAPSATPIRDAVNAFAAQSQPPVSVPQPEPAAPAAEERTFTGEDKKAFDNLFGFDINANAGPEKAEEPAPVAESAPEEEYQLSEQDVQAFNQLFGFGEPAESRPEPTAAETTPVEEPVSQPQDVSLPPENGATLSAEDEMAFNDLFGLGTPVEETPAEEVPAAESAPVEEPSLSEQDVQAFNQLFGLGEPADSQPEPVEAPVQPTVQTVTVEELNDLPDGPVSAAPAQTEAQPAVSVERDETKVFTVTLEELMGMEDA